MKDLSILIPARNEMFLNKTIDDILSHIEMDTEIIVGLDGSWPFQPIPDNPKVILLHHSESIGQRAITNECAKLAKGKYLMKVDAHCAFDQGFDRKMIELMEPDITMVPIMRNLHAFNWKCVNGHIRYQGPSGPCNECGELTEMDVVWISKHSPQSTAYRFDKTMHFQYWNEYGKKQTGNLTETLSIQGSCFMMTREKYFELDVCSEDFNSWGQQGVEVACKTWLSGGRVMVNRTTWYAHMFRTQGGDFGFPYPQNEKAVQENRELSRELFMRNKWPQAIHSFSWLIEKFNPPEWDINEVKVLPTKGILYYTSNRLNMRIADRCRRQMVKSSLPITSVSLKPMKFGRNIYLQLEPSTLSMFKQILAGLESMTENIIYFAEHDVLYHPSHYEFTPSDPFKFYYNGNYWFVRMKDGFAIHYDVSPLSGLVGYREQLITHFRERVEMIEKEGFTLHMGYEPMTHKRVKWKKWFNFEIFQSNFPNIDLATGGNQSWKRWSKDKFIKQPKFWEEGTWENIPGWGDLRKIL